MSYDNNDEDIDPNDIYEQSRIDEMDREQEEMEDLEWVDDDEF